MNINNVLQLLDELAGYNLGGTTMCKYRCSKCGSEKLSHNKYVKCTTPLAPQNDGTREYLASVIDEDDFLPVDFGFICGDCSHPVELSGFRIETERELDKYLAMDPAVRDQEELKYQECLKEQAEEAEQREKEQEEALKEELRDAEQKDEAA